MDTVKLTLPDGSSRDVPCKTTLADFALLIGAGLAKAAVAGKIDGKLVDLSAVVDADSAVEIVTLKSAEGLEIYRHTTSHIMAQAVQELYKGIKVTIGPVIENGFYYDFDYEKCFSPEDFEKIEAKMAEIVKRDLPIEREVLSKKDAVKLFEEMGESIRWNL